MIQLMQFQNFKVLRDAQLPLSRFTLLVGPNGSGKSTAMQALRAVGQPRRFELDKVATVGLVPTDTEAVEVVLHWGGVHEGVVMTTHWGPGGWSQSHTKFTSETPSDNEKRSINAKLAEIRVYALHTNAYPINQLSLKCLERHRWVKYGIAASWVEYLWSHESCRAQRIPSGRGGNRYPYRWSTA